MLALVENARRKQLAWIDAILGHKGWSPTRLARSAGINHSTLSKFLNDPLNAAQLNTLSVEKIANVGGIPPYQTEPAGRTRGLAEAEAVPYRVEQGDNVAIAVAAMRGGNNGLQAWVLKSRALETAGYLPGDVVMVDMNAEAQSGDVVCAQIYDRHGRTDTVIRIYEHPFLTAATHDRELMRPLLVDGERVSLLGVVVASFRPRRAN